MRIKEIVEGIEIDRAIRSASNLNRPMLTLRHLNALRKLRAQTDAEMADHLELIQWVYGADAGCDEDGKRSKSMKPIKPIKTIKPFELIKPTRRKDE